MVRFDMNNQYESLEKTFSELFRMAEYHSYDDMCWRIHMAVEKTV